MSHTADALADPDLLADAGIQAAAPPLTDDMVHRLIGDLAENIYPSEELAVRYGFAGRDHLRQYLCARPVLAQRLITQRRIWESGENITARTRRLNEVLLMEATPEIGKILFDPKSKPQEKLDAMKLTAQISGLLGPGARDQGQGGGGAAGARFAVNFFFSGGRTESITTVETAEPVEIEGEVAA